MELPVLIEPLPDRPGYAAQLGAPFHIRAEAATAEDARQQLAVLLQRRLEEGARVEAIRVPTGPGAASGGGWLPDDELTQEWLRQVQQYREECDAAERRRLLGDTGQDKAVS